MINDLFLLVCILCGGLGLGFFIGYIISYHMQLCNYNRFITEKNVVKEIEECKKNLALIHSIEKVLKEK